MRAVRDVAGAMVAEEQRLLAIRNADQQASVRVFYTTLAIAGLLLVLVAAVTLATILRYTRDLAQCRATSCAISPIRSRSRLPSAPPI